MSLGRGRNKSSREKVRGRENGITCFVSFLFLLLLFNILLTCESQYLVVVNKIYKNKIN